MSSGKTTKRAVSSSAASRALRDLCARVREVRLRTAGSSGVERIARALDVPATTWRAYERDRTPPVIVLVGLSEFCGVDLRWLLTGQFPRSTLHGGQVPIGPDHARMIARFAELLGRGRRAVPAMTAFIDLLDDASIVGDRAVESRIRSVPIARRSPKRTPTNPAGGQPRMIPVLGRTAAGVPCFWRRNDRNAFTDITETFASPNRDAFRTPAACAAVTDHDAKSSRSVRLVQQAQPVTCGPVSVTEFVSGRALQSLPRDAFALRIDGDSMDPVLAHGDLVVVSPARPAQPGKPAVLRLENQIGVTCKLFRPDGDRVSLIPINDSFPVTKHPTHQIEWALAVLFRIRPNPPRPDRLRPLRR